jgi:hypothetical protein
MGLAWKAEKQSSRKAAKTPRKAEAFVYKKLFLSLRLGGFARGMPLLLRLCARNAFASAALREECLCFCCFA